MKLTELKKMISEEISKAVNEQETTITQFAISDGAQTSTMNISKLAKYIPQIQKMGPVEVSMYDKNTIKFSLPKGKAQANADIRYKAVKGLGGSLD